MSFISPGRSLIKMRPAAFTHISLIPTVTQPNPAILSTILPLRRFASSSSSSSTSLLSRSVVSLPLRQRQRSTESTTSTSLSDLSYSRHVVGPSTSSRFIATSASTTAQLAIRQLGIRSFHSSNRRERPVPVVFAAAAAVVKSTAFLGVATTISRVLFILIPVTVFGKAKIGKFLRRLDRTAPTFSENSKEFYERHCLDEKFAAVHCSRKEWKAGRGEINIKNQFLSLANTGISAEEAESRNLVKRDEEARSVWTHHNSKYHCPPLSAEAMAELKELDLDSRIEIYKIRIYEGLRRFYLGAMSRFMRLFWIILSAPAGFVLLAILFGLERVPFTGRVRVILLSPEEEYTMTTNMSGVSWYESVITLLTSPNNISPALIPEYDWRYQWVLGTLRKLEKGVEDHLEYTKQVKEGLISPREQRFLELQPGDIYPPEPSYPLMPRPRPAALLHEALPNGNPEAGREHLEVGPPYSLMVLQKNERNAMSYGFGTGGSAGIVVFTGILDEILNTGVAEEAESSFKDNSTTQQTGLTFLQRLLGSSPPPPPPPRPSHPIPTEAQTLQLASVLAHELSHLLLSHHLESISAENVLLPSVFSLGSDLLRTLVFPITMIFGPFVNDAIANMSRVSVNAAVLSDCIQGCSDVVQEQEADIVGLRIMWLAGYDPRQALEFWSSKDNGPCLKEEQRAEQERDAQRHHGKSWFPFRGSSSHMEKEARENFLKRELTRWKTVEPKEVIQAEAP